MFWKNILWIYLKINIYYNSYNNIIKVFIVIKNLGGDIMILEYFGELFLQFFLKIKILL
jgi:hypothetical protein